MNPNALRYNHPCGDLLECGRRREYLDICVPLYIISTTGKWEAARAILEGGREHLVRYSITENKGTMLHVAATARSTEFVRHLVEMMEKEDLELQNEEGNTAFCLAAIGGHTEMCKIMVEKNKEIMTIRGSENMMPVYLAASHTHYYTTVYLYDRSQEMASDVWTDDDRNRFFLKCIEVGFFSIPLRILDESGEIQLPQEKHIWDALNILARMPDAFYDETTSTIQRNITSGTGFLPTESEATQLLRKIWKKVVVKPKDEIDVILRGPVTKIDEKDTYPSSILFVAAEMGNIQFLVELIREDPNLIWRRNDDGQTIFHIAVFHRHRSIYNLLHEIGSMRDTVTQLTDKEGNNMLHSVGMNPGRNTHEHMSGPAFQLQHEILWFLEVMDKVPPLSRVIKNAAGQIPFQVFTENHKSLASEGEEWIKRTVSQYMVASALIATIGFSVAFSIPGGFNQINGFPMFLQNKALTVFVILDAISFILSSVSIILFLSIMSSSYEQHDFLRLMPNLILGQATLFLSIFTVMIAFSASFFVLYHNNLAIIISILVSIPVIVFIKQQYPLFVNAFHLSYNSRYLFKPGKQKLYYQNPKF